MPYQPPAPENPQTQTSDQRLLQAFKDLESDLQIEGSAVVKKILSDDLKGSRHQRFLIRLSHDQTILVAHNIDLAPRINSLREGDSIRFYGEYEWNNQGGVIHWTHRDPQGKHPHGWIEHDGIRYE
ncbi:DUF3465 domain-containing protein [Amphritea balenae]|uniref:DUF3465 domain-containing protein n=2 Tax=Amphritea balenae TaxID=452629 RepID=A0A3P1SPW6_9GAMM|nr:DUF3465 domain-containing protein [Amphritea balenae]